MKGQDLCRRTPSGLLWTRLLLILTFLAFVPTAAQHAQAPPPTPPAGLPDKEWEAWEALPPRLRAKVDPRILAELRGEIRPAHLSSSPDQAPPPPQEKTRVRTRFLVTLQAQADLEKARARTFATRAEQRTAVVDALVETARVTQAPVKALLDAHVASGDAAAYLPYYIFNGIAVEGNLATLIALAERADVVRIAANYRLIRFERPTPGAPPYPPASSAPDPQRGHTPSGAGLSPANWNIDLVDAERVWDELDIDGRGAVVASFDTGVDWEHAALQAQYRGWNGTAADHNYNWFEFDARDTAYWDPGGDYGPSASPEPYDCAGHGTHTTGTMVGTGGTPTTQIGMAPGATWIAVPGLCDATVPGGYADDIGGIRTFQWLMCPTDLSGELSTRDCSRAPDVINNSWGSSNPADDTFRPIVQALRAAGIAPVFSSGNPAAGPGSIASPASIPEAIAVGATDRYDAITPFSGLGPSFYPGVRKPEFTAPGQDVLSSVPGGYYESFGGTSMAAPHVSGLIALMISADLRDGHRDLSLEELLSFMQYSAVDLGAPGPDDAYGFGRIDAYRAVRWVLGAGDLQGTVRDADTQAPVSGATMTGIAASSGDRFVTRADANGVYSATVPGGVYDVRVRAFGYAEKTFAGVSVLTGTNTLIDFDLPPLATRLLTGRVRDQASPYGTTPVRGARVYLDAMPDLFYETGADGTYTLRLPLGKHDISVEAAGYRIAHTTVTVDDAGASQDVDLIPAPSILLVEADGYQGWFYGRPARNFFQYALDARGFLYDTVVVTDRTSPPNLSPYDVVIWAHTGGSPGLSGSETVDALTSYLDSGGRLILSGQDIGEWDGYGGQPYYFEYLHAWMQTGFASGPGGRVSGSGFLSGLSLKLNEAALYGYPNTAMGMSPDGVVPQDGNAYTILTYDGGIGEAALAIDPCNQPFRAVYMAVGYENLGPRAYHRPPEYVDLLEKSIVWVAQTKPRHDVASALTPGKQVGISGTAVRYGLTLANTGRMPDTYDLSVSGNAWQTRIYDGSVEAPPSIELQPCTRLQLTVQVDIPGTTREWETDSFEITASSRVRPDVQAHVLGTTTASQRWQMEAPMPTPRYRLAAAYLPGDIHYYAIGGLSVEPWNEPLGANERYNACSGEWSTMAPMPTPRGNITAAAIDQKIYVPGGYVSGTHLDVLEIYDPASDTWAGGAPLPAPRSGMAVAAYGGKLYAFGGVTPEGRLSDKTYVYDPGADAWEEKAPLPGGARGHAAAATLNAKIYVVGGWYVNTVEVYDPETDTWSTAAAMNDARQSPGLVVAPDGSTASGGKLYVSGGGTDYWRGLGSAERYDPALDEWLVLPSLNDSARAGTASAYAGGRIYTVGGVGGYSESGNVHESLRLSDSFCGSTKHAAQNTAYPFESPIPAPTPPPESAPPAAPDQARGINTRTFITYTITMHGDDTALDAASLLDPIPQGTTFGRFGDNAAGAAYNAAQNRIEWYGAIPSNSPPLSFVFGLDVDLSRWHFGDRVVNEATFSSGAGIVFTRTAAVRLDFPDPSQSTHTVDKTWALSGDRLTYTLQITNPSIISDVITVHDPIPAHTSYIPGSLTYHAGSGAYDEDTQTIRWAGILPALVSQRIAGYEWGDSEGRGTIPGVAPDWHDMTGATDTYVSGDDGTYGTFPIGFAFDFWGVKQREFYVSPNGWVGFSTGGGSIVDCSDYGTWDGPNNFIGGFGGDRAVYDWSGGSITYKLFGSEPDRRLVVQFTNIRYRYSSDQDTLDMQIVLYEKSGKILVQYQDLTTSPAAAEIGVEGPDPDYLYQLYGDVCPAQIQEGMAILFQPRLVPAMGHSTALSYAVAVDESAPANTWITNTATLSSSFITVQRHASTWVNAVDLSASHKTAPAQVSIGQALPYQLLLRNTGVQPAAGSTLTDPLPPDTAYVSGSLACSGGDCDYDTTGHAVRWSGEILPGGTVTVSLAVTLTTIPADRTPITNTAALEDGYGHTHQLQAVTLARVPDLSGSLIQAAPETVGAGQAVSYTIYVHNSSVIDTIAEVRDALPVGLTYVPGSLSCGTGTCSYDGAAIVWEGGVRGKSMVPIRFQATVSAGAWPGQQITNAASVIDRTTGRSHTVAAAIRLPGSSRQTIFMPVVTKNAP